jgi:hypothetical protein
MALLGFNPKSVEEVVEMQLCTYYDGDESYREQLREKLLKVETSVRFEGKTYLVPNVAYYISKPIELPDGRQVVVGGWLESMPPQGGATLIEGQLFPYTDVYKAVERN